MPRRVRPVPRRAANAAPGDPLPACAYRDVATRYSAYRDWKKTLVDTIERVGKHYAPPDLVSTSRGRTSRAAGASAR